MDCCYIFVSVEATAFQMRGTLLPSLKQAFTVSPSLLGFVATAGTLGFMLAVLVSGMVAGRIDLHQVLFGSMSVVAVSVFFMGVAPIFWYTS